MQGHRKLTRRQLRELKAHIEFYEKNLDRFAAALAAIHWFKPHAPECGGWVTLDLEAAGACADMLGVSLSKFISDAVRKELDLPPLQLAAWPAKGADVKRP